jgi:hypothetical protein
MARVVRGVLITLTATSAVALYAGTASAADRATIHRMTSCPVGYQIDPQNSQQCIPLTSPNSPCDPGMYSEYQKINPNCPPGSGYAG